MSEVDLAIAMENESGTICGREPAMVLALVQAVIALVVAFGLNLAPDQIGAILAVTAVILGLITRSQVSPALVRDGYLRGALSPQATQRQMDVLAAYVAAGGSVAGGCRPRPHPPQHREASSRRPPRRGRV